MDNDTKTGQDVAEPYDAFLMPTMDKTFEVREETGRTWAFEDIGHAFKMFRRIVRLGYDCRIIAW